MAFVYIGVEVCPHPDERNTLSEICVNVLGSALTCISFSVSHQKAPIPILWTFFGIVIDVSLHWEKASPLM